MRTIALLIAAALLSACASRDQLPLDLLSSPDFSFDAALPLVQTESRPLLDSGVKIAGHGVFEAQSDFRIESGDVIDPQRWSGWYDSGGLPHSMARQLFSQQLSSQFIEVADTPVQIKLHNTQETRWLLAGTAEREQRGAELSWAPALAALSLSWTEPQAQAAPLLDCTLQGAVRLQPFARGGPALRFGGRDCIVTATRAPSVQNANLWSVAMLWPGTEQTRLRLLAVNPSAPVGEQWQIDPGYELGLSHALPLGEWIGRAEVALRRPAGVPAAQARAQWLLNASLRRDLRQVGLTANLRSGSGDDWFLPLPEQRSSEVGLSFDFSPWLLQNWSNIDLSLSGRWLERKTAIGSHYGDAAIDTRLRIRW